MVNILSSVLDPNSGNYDFTFEIGFRSVDERAQVDTALSSFENYLQDVTNNSACNVIAIPADVNCQGAFGARCDINCEKTYEISTPRQGNGLDCANADGFMDIQDCETGVNECADEFCVDDGNFVDDDGDDCAAYAGFKRGMCGNQTIDGVTIAEVCMRSCDNCWDPNDDPCACKDAWSQPGYGDDGNDCLNQAGCPAAACDGKPNSWCEVKDPYRCPQANMWGYCANNELPDGCNCQDGWSTRDADGCKEENNLRGGGLRGIVGCPAVACDGDDDPWCVLEKKNACRALIDDLANTNQGGVWLNCTPDNVGPVATGECKKINDLTSTSDCSSITDETACEAESKPNVFAFLPPLKQCTWQAYDCDYNGNTVVNGDVVQEACPVGLQDGTPDNNGITKQCDKGTMKKQSDLCKPRQGCMALKLADRSECAIANPQNCNGADPVKCQVLDCTQRNNLYYWGDQGYYDSSTRACKCFSFGACNDAQPLDGCVNSGGTDWFGSPEQCFNLNTESENDCNNYQSQQLKTDGCSGGGVCASQSDSGACGQIPGCQWTTCSFPAQAYNPSADSNSGECQAYQAPCSYDTCSITTTYLEGNCDNYNPKKSTGRRRRRLAKQVALVTPRRRLVQRDPTYKCYPAAGPRGQDRCCVTANNDLSYDATVTGNNCGVTYTINRLGDDIHISFNPKDGIGVNIVGLSADNADKQQGAILAVANSSTKFIRPPYVWDEAGQTADTSGVVNNYVEQYFSNAWQTATFAIEGWASDFTKPRYILTHQVNNAEDGAFPMNAVMCSQVITPEELGLVSDVDCSGAFELNGQRECNDQCERNYVIDTPKVGGGQDCAFAAGVQACPPAACACQWTNGNTVVDFVHNESVDINCADDPGYDASYIGAITYECLGGILNAAGDSCVKFCQDDQGNAVSDGDAYTVGCSANQTGSKDVRCENGIEVLVANNCKSTCQGGLVHGDERQVACAVGFTGTFTEQCTDGSIVDLNSQSNCLANCGSNVSGVVYDVACPQDQSGTRQVLCTDGNESYTGNEECFDDCVNDGMVHGATNVNACGANFTGSISYECDDGNVVETDSCVADPVQDPCPGQYQGKDVIYSSQDDPCGQLRNQACFAANDPSEAATCAARGGEVDCGIDAICAWREGLACGGSANGEVVDQGCAVGEQGARAEECVDGNFVEITNTCVALITEGCAGNDAACAGFDAQGACDNFAPAGAGVAEGCVGSGKCQKGSNKNKCNKQNDCLWTDCAAAGGYFDDANFQCVPLDSCTWTACGGGETFSNGACGRRRLAEGKTLVAGLLFAAGLHRRRLQACAEQYACADFQEFSAYCCWTPDPVVDPVDLDCGNVTANTTTQTDCDQDRLGQEVSYCNGATGQLEYQSDNCSPACRSGNGDLVAVGHEEDETKECIVNGQGGSRRMQCQAGGGALVEIADNCVDGCNVNGNDLADGQQTQTACGAGFSGQATVTCSNGALAEDRALCVALTCDNSGNAVAHNDSFTSACDPGQSGFKQFLCVNGSPESQGETCADRCTLANGQVVDSGAAYTNACPDDFTGTVSGNCNNGVATDDAASACKANCADSSNDLTVPDSSDYDLGCGVGEAGANRQRCQDGSYVAIVGGNTCASTGCGSRGDGDQWTEACVVGFTGDVQLTCTAGSVGRDESACEQQCFMAGRYHDNGANWVEPCSQGTSGVQGQRYNCDAGNTVAVSSDCLSDCSNYKHGDTWDTPCQANFIGRVENECNDGNAVASVFCSQNCAGGVHGTTWQEACGANQAGYKEFTCNDGAKNQVKDKCVAVVPSNNNCANGFTPTTFCAVFPTNSTPRGQNGDQCFQDTPECPDDLPDWPATKAGEYALGVCPGGTTRQRYCGKINDSLAEWVAPDPCPDVPTDPPTEPPTDPAAPTVGCVVRTQAQGSSVKVNKEGAADAECQALVDQGSCSAHVYKNKPSACKWVDCGIVQPVDYNAPLSGHQYAFFNGVYNSPCDCDRVANGNVDCQPPVAATDAPTDMPSTEPSQQPTEDPTDTNPPTEEPTEPAPAAAGVCAKNGQSPTDCASFDNETDCLAQTNPFAAFFGGDTALCVWLEPEDCDDNGTVVPFGSNTAAVACGLGKVGPGTVSTCTYGGLKAGGAQCYAQTGCTPKKREGLAQDAVVCRPQAEQSCDGDATCEWTDCTQPSEKYVWGADAFFNPSNGQCACLPGKVCKTSVLLAGCVFTDDQERFGGSPQTCLNAGGGVGPAANGADQQAAHQATCDNYKPLSLTSQGCSGGGSCGAITNSGQCSGSCTWDACNSDEVYLPSANNNAGGCVAYGPGSTCGYQACAADAPYVDGKCAARRRLSEAPARRRLQGQTFPSEGAVYQCLGTSSSPNFSDQSQEEICCRPNAECLPEGGWAKTPSGTTITRVCCQGGNIMQSRTCGVGQGADASVWDDPSDCPACVDQVTCDEEQDAAGETWVATSAGQFAFLECVDSPGAFRKRYCSDVAGAGEWDQPTTCPVVATGACINNYESAASVASYNCVDNVGQNDCNCSDCGFFPDQSCSDLDTTWECDFSGQIYSNGDSWLEACPNGEVGNGVTYVCDEGYSNPFLSECLASCGGNRAEGEMWIDDCEPANRFVGEIQYLCKAQQGGIPLRVVMNNNCEPIGCTAPDGTELRHHQRYVEECPAGKSGWGTQYECNYGNSVKLWERCADDVACAFVEEDRVEGNWRDLGVWYAGKVCSVSANQQSCEFRICYDDGDVEVNVPVDRIRAEPIKNNQDGPEAYHVCDRVEGNFGGLGKWYPGRIRDETGINNTFDVSFDDGDFASNMDPVNIRILEQQNNDFFVGNLVVFDHWLEPNHKCVPNTNNSYDDAPSDRRVTECAELIRFDDDEALAPQSKITCEADLNCEYKARGHHSPRQDRWLEAKVVEVTAACLYNVVLGDGTIVEDVTPERMIHNCRDANGNEIAAEDIPREEADYIAKCGFQGYAAGDAVEANWRGFGEYYGGTILYDHADDVPSNPGYFDIKYSDGDRENMVPSYRIKKSEIYTGLFAIDQRVDADWKGLGLFYSGDVTAADASGYTIQYHDGTIETNVPESRILGDHVGAQQYQPGTLAEVDWHGYGDYYPVVVFGFDAETHLYSVRFMDGPRYEKKGDPENFRWAQCGAAVEYARNTGNAALQHTQGPIAGCEEQTTISPFYMRPFEYKFVLGDVGKARWQGYPNPPEGYPAEVCGYRSSARVGQGRTAANGYLHEATEERRYVWCYADGDVEDFAEEKYFTKAP